jgi:hypothetical protein
MTSAPMAERGARSSGLPLYRKDFWAAVAITAMWLAVLFDAIFGPDIVSQSTTGYTRVPSAIVVALFATIGTASVAHAGFRGGSD